MEIEIEELKSKIRGLKFCLKNCYIVEKQQHDTINKLNHQLDVTDEYVAELKVKLNMVNDELEEIKNNELRHILSWDTSTASPI